MEAHGSNNTILVIGWDWKCQELPIINSKNLSLGKRYILTLLIIIYWL